MCRGVDLPFHLDLNLCLTGDLWLGGSGRVPAPLTNQPDVVSEAGAHPLPLSWSTHQQACETCTSRDFTQGYGYAAVTHHISLLNSRLRLNSQQSSCELALVRNTRKDAFLNTFPLDSECRGSMHILR